MISFISRSLKVISDQKRLATAHPVKSSGEQRREATYIRLAKLVEFTLGRLLVAYPAKIQRIFGQEREKYRPIKSMYTCV